MKENLKLIPDKSGQNSKLRILFALNVIFCILIFIPIISDAAYKIYLKNGRTISGIEEIKHENGNIKIFKEGILLDMPKTNILKIEEYKPAFKEKTQEDGDVESGETPVESQSPDYTDYRKSYKTAPVEEPAEETAGEEETTEETPMVEKTEKSKTKIKDTGSGEFKDGVLEPGPQLKELRAREKDKTLPSQFKPYKDFIEKQYQQQKKNVEKK